MVGFSRTALLGLIVATAALAGCRGQTSRQRPIVGIRNMYNQPRYNIQDESEFYADGRTMRPLVEGVVARNEEVDPRIAEGLLEDGTGYVLALPQEAVDRGGGMNTLLRRGQERYNIYCAACHGETGTGEGVVKQRAQAVGAAAFVPANLHDERLRHIPDGQLYATIAHGKGNMPPQSQSVPVQDRWAIVAYVRALQLAAPKPVLDTTPTVTDEAPIDSTNVGDGDGGTENAAAADAGAKNNATGDAAPQEP